MSLFAGLANIHPNDQLDDVLPELNIPVDMGSSTERIYDNTPTPGLTSFIKNTIDNKYLIDGELAEKGNRPKHQVKITAKPDGSKFIEIYTYGDLDYHTNCNQFRTLLTIIESLTDKDTLYLHLGIAWYPMVTMSALGYTAAIKSTPAYVIIETTNIYEMQELALILCANEIRIGQSSRCSFKDITTASYGTSVDNEALDEFNENRRSEIKELILSKGFMTLDEWDNTIAKNKVFSSHGEELIARFNKPAVAPEIITIDEDEDDNPIVVSD